MAVTPLKHMRIDQELTLFSLGRKTGINPGRLSMLERSLVPPREDEIRRLAAALDVDPAELFEPRR